MNTLSLPKAYLIEQARAQDLEAILALLRAVHFDTRRLDVRNFMVARASGGKIIGCGQIKTVGRSRVLSSVSVEFESREQGMGHALVSALVAREAGPVMLMCVGRLISYYASHKFQVVSPRRAPFDLFWRWLVLRVMGLFLPGWENAEIMERPGPNDGPGGN